MTNQEFAMNAANFLSSKKATDIKVINIAEKSSFADYLVVANGGNDRHVAALADDLEDEFAKIELLPKSIAGKNNTGWVLMDYADIIVNIFTPELRERYNLEQVWGDCEIINIED